MYAKAKNSLPAPMGPLAACPVASGGIINSYIAILNDNAITECCLNSVAPRTNLFADTIGILAAASAETFVADAFPFALGLALSAFALAIHHRPNAGIMCW